MMELIVGFNLSSYSHCIWYTIALVALSKTGIQNITIPF